MTQNNWTHVVWNKIKKTPNSFKPQWTAQDRLYKNNYYFEFWSNKLFCRNILLSHESSQIFQITSTFLASKFHIWKSYYGSAFFFFYFAIICFIIHIKSASGFSEVQMQTTPFHCSAVPLWTIHMVFTAESPKDICFPRNYCMYNVSGW